MKIPRNPPFFQEMEIPASANAAPPSGMRLRLNAAAFRQKGDTLVR
jgi:hypothetical protein